MRVWCAILLLFLLPGGASAGDFWKEKPYQQWTKEEVRRLLTNSPWVRTYRVFSDPNPFGAGREGDVRSGGRPEIPLAVGGGSGSPQEPAAEPVTQASYFLIWSSAATVRKAFAQQQVLLGSARPEQVEQSLAQPVQQYTIILIGPGLSDLAKEEPQLLKTKVFLRPKKTKQKLMPEQVRLERSPDGSQVTAASFSFSRTTAAGEPAIPPDEKAVEFGCELGRLLIRVQFDPRRMKVGDTADM